LTLAGLAVAPLALVSAIQGEGENRGISAGGGDGFHERAESR
jgi:hypothetical protein